MAVNFGGAGFSFVAKDDGLTKTLTSVEKGFQGVYDKFKMVANSATKMGGVVGTGLRKMGGFGRQAIGGIAGALDSMAQKALNPKIDNAFSSMHAQFAKTWGSVTVGMNLTSKEAKKWQRAIGSAAFALNVDMGETAKNWAEFKKQGIDLRVVMGKKGMYGAIKDLIRVTETLGISGEQMAITLSGMVKGFGFTQKRAMALYDTIFAMGKAFGVGKEAAQEYPGIFQEINKQLADFGVAASAKDVEKMSISITKLAVGLQQSLGGSFKDATATSKALFSTLLGERRNIVNMFRGMGGEFSEFSKALAEKGGVRKALMMVLQDPAKFMDKLREMAKKTEKQGGKMGLGLQRLVGVMNKVAGPDVTYAMKGNWDKASDAMRKLGIISSNTMKNLGAMTKAAKKSYRSGRTAGDAFTIMLQQQEAAIHKLSDPLLKNWIKEQRKGFKDFRKGLQKVVKKGGPLGELTKRLLLVQRVGLSGFFSGLGGMGPMIMKTMQTMGPMLAAFAHLGMSLALIGKLLLPGGIILIGLAMFHKGAREKILGTLDNIWSYLSENVPRWIPMVRKALTELWQKAVEGVKWAMDVVAPMMNRLAWAIKTYDWGGLVQRTINFIGKFFRGVFTAIFEAGSADFDTSTPEGRFLDAGVNLIGALGRGALDALKVIGKNILDFFTDWSMGFEEGLRSKGKLLGGIFITALFFGSTRKLALQGAWMLVKLIAQYLVWPVLVMMGQFFMGMLARQGTYHAVSMGMEKASLAKKLGMAITYHVKSLIWSAWEWTKKTAINAAGWVRDRIVDAAGWLWKKTAAAAAWVATAAITVGGWIAVGVANAAGWAATKAVDAAAWLLRGIVWAAGMAIQLGIVVAGWVATAAATAAGWVATNAIMIAGALVAAASWAIAFWPVTLVIAGIAAIGLAFYALTGRLGPEAQKIARIITWPFVFLWETVKPLVNAIKALFSGDFAGFFKNMADFVGKVITAPFRYVWGVVKHAVAVISMLWNALRNRLGETGQAIMDVISYPFRMGWKIISGIVDRIKSAWNSITNAVGNMGGRIVSGIRSLFGGSAKSAKAVSGTISNSLQVTAEKVRVANEKSMASTVARSEQTKQKVIGDARATSAEVQVNSQYMRQGVNTQYTAMQHHAGQQFGLVNEYGSRTANNLMGYSAQAVNSTNSSWSQVPPFLSKMFTSALGVSAKSNTRLGRHGASAANTTNRAWAKSGSFVSRVWAVTGKAVLQLWKGITEGALTSSDAVIKAALASAKASGANAKQLEKLKTAYKEIQKLEKKHRDFQKKQREEREASVFDWIKRFKGSGIKKLALGLGGVGAGYDPSTMLEALSQKKYGKQWTEKQVKSAKEMIGLYKSLEKSAAKMEKLGSKGKQEAQKLRSQMGGIRKKLGVIGITEMDDPMSARRAVERQKSIILQRTATDIYAREKALRQTIKDMKEVGGKHVRLVIEGNQAYVKGLDSPRLRRFFKSRARFLRRKYAKEAGEMSGATITAPTIGEGGAITATKITAGRVSVKGAKGGQVKSMAATPAGFRKEEKRVNWTVSNETQKAMAEVGGSLENLAASIRGLGKHINVMVTFSGDLGPFLRHLKRLQQGSIGNLPAKPQTVS